MAKVFEGKLLRENCEKWCILVRFGICFDQMFLEIIPKITVFIEKLMILPARLLYGVLIKLLEIILKHATSILMNFGIKNDCVNVELMML